MLRVWNVSLVILTFFLTIFGTFMTRSGVVQSVHAFGEDKQLALMFTVFMVSFLVFSFGLVIKRLPLLRARYELDSWVSREAAFMANNWILLFSAMFVLFATMFPTLSEAVTGERLTVGPPFFNKWMLPIGLILLLLTGIGPLLAWRKSTILNLRDQFLWPVAAALVTTGTMLALGVRVWSSGMCFALAAFTMGTILQEFVRGTRVRQGASDSDFFTALIGLIARSRRRYGGYLVHVGIVIMFLGFAGEGFKQEEQVLLTPGQTVSVGSFVVRHDAVKLTDDGQKQMITGHVTVTKNGEDAGEMLPAKWYFRKHEEEPTTEVAIRRSFSEDLYIVMAGYDVAQQSATFHVVVNPLVNWIWSGFGFLAFGTLIAWLPERTFAFATAGVPSGAATTGVMLLLSLLTATSAWAQAVPHNESPQFAAKVAATPLERELNREIICMCGTCGRKLIGECSCGLAAEMRDEVATLVAAGKGRDEVYQHFITKYGSQEPLAAPIDKGFNRLAWFVPYALGTLSAMGLGFAAFRLSQRPSRGAVAAGQGVQVDAEERRLESRLDDELRELD